jgi:putative tricarboxylic transport membrane protein
MAKKDSYFALILLLISGLAFLETLSYPTQSAYFPRIIIAILAFFSAALFAKSFILSRKQQATGAPAQEGTVQALPSLQQAEVVRKVLMMIFCTMAYLVLIGVIGYYVSSIVYLPVMMWLLGVRKIRTIVLSSGGIILLVYLVFSTFLRVPLPEGLAF